MTSKHLGDRIHDLLDGRLTGEKAATAMSHLGECETCSARWHELRTAREALSTADAGIDMSFAQRLLDKERIAQIAAQESKAKARAAAPPDRRPMALASLLAVAAATLVISAWSLGAPHPVSLEFAESGPAAVGQAQTVAFVDPQGMRSGDGLRSWIHPDFSESQIIPIEAHVKQRDNGSKVLVAKLLLGQDSLIVTEEHGTLHPAVQDFPLANVDAVDVFVIRYANPAQVAWQTGDVVIAMGCECPLSVLEGAAAEFPTAEGPGTIDRILDGFEELADLLP